MVVAPVRSDSMILSEVVYVVTHRRVTTGKPRRTSSGAARTWCPARGRCARGSLVHTQLAAGNGVRGVAGSHARCVRVAVGISAERAEGRAWGAREQLVAAPSRAVGARDP